MPRCLRHHPNYVVFDIDGTLTQHDNSWQYIHESFSEWENGAEKYQKQFHDGKISYEEFCLRDASHWRGFSAKKIEKLFDQIQLTKNAKNVIGKLEKRKYCVLALSTGLQFTKNRLRGEVGIKNIYTNRLRIYRGRLTGGVRIDVDHNGKGAFLKKLIPFFNGIRNNVICVGDGIGDLSMMRITGYPIAFNAKDERVKAKASYVCESNDLEEVYEVIVKRSEKSDLS